MLAKFNFKSVKFLIIFLICLILFFEYVDCGLKHKILLKKLVKAGLLKKAFTKKIKVIIPIPIPFKMPKMPMMSWSSWQPSWQPSWQSWEPPSWEPSWQSSSWQESWQPPSWESSSWQDSWQPSSSWQGSSW